MKVIAYTLITLFAIGLSAHALAGESGKSKMEDAQQAQFSELDTNQDGYVSQDELNQYGATAAGEDTKSMLEKHDSNNDGRISQEEFRQKSDKMKDDTSEGSW